PDADSLFSGGETLDAVFPPRADDDETLRTALGREVHFESAGARTAEGGGSDGFGIAAALLTVLFWLFVFSSLSSRRRRGGLLPWLLLWGVFGGSGRNS
ncbi:MAG: hypothetical protein ACTTKL_06910, partial [Treponema sp.]